MEAVRPSTLLAGPIFFALVTRQPEPFVSIFLSAEELQELTGYQKPALQRRWLTQNGYQFDVRGDSRPVVMEAQVRFRQFKHLAEPANALEEPDLDALDRMG